MLVKELDEISELSLAVDIWFNRQMRSNSGLRVRFK